MRGLALATLLSASAAIAAASGLLPAVGLFVFKPLTTLMVFVHAWRRDGGPPIVRRAVLFGLVLSLAGDVALLWPQPGFLPGLVCFLLAHLAYLLAFTRLVRFAARPLPFIAYAALAGAVLSQLWPGVPTALRVPVLAYVLCLAAMAAQTAVVWRASAHNGDARRAAGLAVGGLLFLVSDTLLATDRFHGALPQAAACVLGTYWAAQWCIASWLRPNRFS